MWETEVKNKRTGEIEFLWYDGTNRDFLKQLEALGWIEEEAIVIKQEIID